MYLSFKTFPEGIPNEGVLFVDHRKSGRMVLIQSSVSYKGSSVNVCQWLLSIK